MPGRSIRIFLPDGLPTGLRTAELGLSTIKAVVIPRTLLGVFAARPEAKRTGIYFRVGADPKERRGRDKRKPPITGRLVSRCVV